MSWFKDIGAWFGRTPQADQMQRGGKTRNSQNKEGLSQAKAVLAAEQAELAREVEGLLRAYNEKVESLAWRVRSLPPQASAAEVAHIREIQRELKLVVQRLDAAVKSRQELEKDLVDWRERESGSQRAEIIRSELRIRGLGEEMPADLPGIGVDYRPLSQCGPFARKIGDLDDGREDWNEEDLLFLDEEQLVAAIRDATREAERWHAIPEEELDEDALAQVHHVRELNALLKRLDRQRGVERDRIDIAISTRE